MWGLGSSDEMCIDFISYFPREHMESKACDVGAIGEVGAKTRHAVYDPPTVLEVRTIQPRPTTNQTSAQRPKPQNLCPTQTPTPKTTTQT